MRVLVLGGTGAMGIHLVEFLGEKQISTIVTTRKNRSPNGTIKYVQLNAQDFSELKPLLEQHWDAIVDFMVYTTKSFQERINSLLSATSQYVFISSARVYADSEVPIKEDSPRLLDVIHDSQYLGTDEYALTKARQENILTDSGKTNWTIIRPYITYSENRLQLGVLEKEDWLYRALKGRTIVFSKEIAEKTTTLTYGYDVARAISTLIGEEKALGEAYHITTSQPIEWRRVLDIYLDCLEEHIGKRPKVILAELSDFMKFHPASYQIKYDRLYNRIFNSEKIYRFIPAESFTNTENSIRECIQELLMNTSFLTIDWHKEALKDRYTGERTALNEIGGLSAKAKYMTIRYFNNFYLSIKNFKP